KAACSSNWLRTTLERMVPRPSASRATMAAAVSSQLVSMPRTFMRPALTEACLARQGWSKPGAAEWKAQRSQLSGTHTTPFLRLGTRGSPLALRQAELVRAGLATAHGVAPEVIEIVIISTGGDRIQDRP